MMQPHFLYALCEPDDDGCLTARYVGQTPNPKARLRQHINNPNKSTRDWVESLLAAGKKPVMVLLAEIRAPEQFDTDVPVRSDFYADKIVWAGEKCLIEHFHLNEGGDLLNVLYKPTKKKHVWAKKGR